MPDDIDDIADVVGEGDPEGDTPEPDSEGDAEPESPEEDAADTASDDEPTAEGDEADEPSSDAAAEPSAYDKLLAKYGGDKEKLATSVLEQGNSLSQLHQEMREIKDALKARGTPEDEEKAIASDPDVQELAGDVTSLDANIKETIANGKQLVARFGELNTTIASLEGALKHAQDEEKAGIQRELADARAEQKAVLRDHNQAVREVNRMNAELRRASREYKGAIAKVKAKRAEEAQTALTQAEYIRGQRQEFNVTVREAAKQYGVSTESRTFQVLHESVKSRLASFIRTLPDDAPAIDLQEAVELLTAEYAELMGLKNRFQKKSTQKATVDGKPTPEPAEKIPGVKAPKPGQAWTPEYVRARARRLLP